MENLSKRTSTWLECEAKTCCYTRTVHPTGKDVWRIARAFDLPPWAFVTRIEVNDSGSDTFVLDGSSQRYRLALIKSPLLPLGDEHGCVFLLRTRTGAHRCGAGDYRPIDCQVFPGTLRDGAVAIREDLGCTCRAWSLSDMDQGSTRTVLESLKSDEEVYARILDRWNRHQGAGPEGHSGGFLEFCQYLLAAYDPMSLPLDSGRPPAAIA
jgi:hypothetical protein